LLFRGLHSNELLKVAFTGTFPLVANSFSVSHGKSTKDPPPSPAAIFALNLYFFIALPVFSPRSPQSPGIKTFSLTVCYPCDNSRFVGKPNIFVHRTDISLLGRKGI
jgi:hypothetical protein